MADDEVNPLGTPTTNYGWTKPTVGADDNVWGGMLNTNFDGIDTTVKSVSTVANAAQTSTQVDAKIAAAAYVLPPASTTVLGGVKVDGSTVTISGGGVISAAGASIAVSDTAPSSPSAGALWWDSVGAQMYIFYNDGTSSQWAPVVNQGYAPIPAAPYVPPPSAASWTQRNFGGGTTLTSVSNGVLLFETSSIVTIGSTTRAMTIAVPATPYTFDFNMRALGSHIDTDYFVFGAGWTDGTKIQFLAYLEQGNQTSAVTTTNIRVDNYTNFTTRSGQVGTQYGGLFNPADMWMRLADNGTNVTFSISPDGVSYMPIYTVAKASGFLGSSGYTNIGIFLVGGLLGNGGMGQVTLRSLWQH